MDSFAASPIAIAIALSVLVIVGAACTIHAHYYATKAERERWVNAAQRDGDAIVMGDRVFLVHETSANDWIAAVNAGPSAGHPEDGVKYSREIERAYATGGAGGLVSMALANSICEAEVASATGLPLEQVREYLEPSDPLKFAGSGMTLAAMEGARPLTARLSAEDVRGLTESFERERTPPGTAGVGA